MHTSTGSTPNSSPSASQWMPAASPESAATQRNPVEKANSTLGTFQFHPLATLAK